MRDKRIRSEPTVEDKEDWSVLCTILSQGDEWPWSITELVETLDSEDILIIDAINRLDRGGLIRRVADELVYPTRTAIYFERIYEAI